LSGMGVNCTSQSINVVGGSLTCSPPTS
jgi:hypothetical protein